MTEQARESLLLVVTADKDTAASMAELLRLRPDVRVLIAKSGYEGLQLLSAQNVDVVVVEDPLPSMTGPEFVDRVHFKGHGARCIMLTANPEAAAVQRAQQRGRVKCVVAKPLQHDDVMLAVDFVTHMGPEQPAPENA